MGLNSKSEIARNNPIVIKTVEQERAEFIFQKIKSDIETAAKLEKLSNEEYEKLLRILDKVYSIQRASNLLSRKVEIINSNLADAFNHIDGLGHTQEDKSYTTLVYYNNRKLALKHE